MKIQVTEEAAAYMKKHSASSIIVDMIPEETNAG